MTALTSQSTLKRETAEEYKGAPLVVELHPGFMTVFPKGRRERYSISYGAIFEAAGKIAAREERESGPAPVRRKVGR